MRTFTALLFLAIASTTAPALAGELQPALADRLALAPPTARISAIVSLADQAPVSALSQSLRDRGAGRAERHRSVIESLRETARGQAPLLAWLEQGRADGSVAGFTPHWIANLVVVTASPATLVALAARADVAWVEADFAAEPLEAARAFAPGGGSWRERDTGVPAGMVAIGADRVWHELGITGEGSLVAVLDTGADASHPALAARWRGHTAPVGECWLDLLGVSPNSPIDPIGHGTHVLGTLTGLAPGDSIGVAPGAQWIACNAIGQAIGPPFDNAVIAAFEWLADPDGDPETLADVPDVVQNSWGVNEFLGYADCDARWWAVIDNCEAAGVVALFGAGGDGPAAGSLRSPADRASTALSSFAVGTVDASDPAAWPYPLASFSSRGPSDCEAPPELAIKPELVAPGVNVLSCVPGGGYEIWSGSAMAGPHVAGVVALMRSANPDLSVDQIKEILLATARDEGPAGDDNGYGWGCVDAFAAVQVALGSTTSTPGGNSLSASQLRQARPNPFRPREGAVLLSFTLARPSMTRLAVYDVAGRHLRTLIEGHLDLGQHITHWDGRDAQGRPVSAGVYFCRLEAGDLRLSQNVVVLR